MILHHIVGIYRYLPFFGRQEVTPVPALVLIHCGAIIRGDKIKNILNICITRQFFIVDIDHITHTFFIFFIRHGDWQGGRLVHFLLHLADIPVAGKQTEVYDAYIRPDVFHLLVVP